MALCARREPPRRARRLDWLIHLTDDNKKQWTWIPPSPLSRGAMGFGSRQKRYAEKHGRQIFRGKPDGGKGVTGWAALRGWMCSAANAVHLTAGNAQSSGCAGMSCAARLLVQRGECRSPHFRAWKILLEKPDMHIKSHKTYVSNQSNIRTELKVNIK